MTYPYDYPSSDSVMLANQTRLPLDQSNPRQLGTIDWLYALYWASATGLMFTPFFEWSNYLAYAFLPLWLLTFRVRRPVAGTIMGLLSFYILWHVVCFAAAESYAVSWRFMQFRLKVFVIVFLFLCRVSNLKQLELFVWASFIGCWFVLLGTLVWHPSAMEGQRAIGITLQSNMFGRVLGWGFVVGLLASRFRPKVGTLLFILYIPIAGLLILRSGSRGSFVSVVVFLSVYYCFEYLLHSAKNWKLLLPVTIALVAALVSLPLYFSQTEVYQRLFGTGVDLAYDSRVLLAETSLRLFFEHPFLGLGPGGFAAVSSFYYTHATPTQLLVDGGFLLFFAYYGIIIVLWHWASVLIRHHRNDAPSRKLLNLVRASLVYIVISGLSKVLVDDRITLVYLAILSGSLYPWYQRTKMALTGPLPDEDISRETSFASSLFSIRQ